MRLRTIAICLGVLAIALGIGSAYVVLTVFSMLPDVSMLESFEPKQVTYVYSADGKIIGEFFREKRIPLEANAIPQQFKNAIQAAEDTSFESHPGIDIKGIIRALIHDIMQGKLAEGGSTITQQLVKTLFLSPERNISRKIKEALLAIRLEQRYTKDEILQLYVNQIYFGHGAYGAEAAAQIYFGRSLSECKLQHYALLAGLPKAPALYSPFNHPDRCKSRRDYIMTRMAEVGYADKTAVTEAIKSDLEVIPLTRQKSAAPYFLEEVRKILEIHFAQNPEAVYTGGYKITTTLNSDWQQIAEEELLNGLDDIAKRHKKDKNKPETEQLQGAFLAMDVKTGAVVAMVGGRDFDKSPFNRSTQARRQVGSAFKPIVFLAAMESGLSPATIMKDAPIHFWDPWTKRRWSPSNYTRKFSGLVTLMEGLENSINIVAIKLVEQLGIESINDAAQRLGIESQLDQYLSVALGTSDISLREMVTAYATIAGYGMRPTPKLITSIVDPSGTQLLTEQYQVNEATDPVSAFLLIQMLQGVTREGTGKAAQSLRRSVAGKTGTTDDYSDAWFIGFTPSLAAGTWIGYDVKHPIGANETGGLAALPIWIDFMARVYKDKPDEPFPVPDQMHKVEICRESGLRATPKCRRHFSVYLPADRMPERECDIH